MRRLILIALLAAIAWTYSQRTRGSDFRQVVTDRVGCDPSYPSLCIRPPPPHLGCADLGASRFRVFGSDPHGFDANQDGIGCGPFDGR